MFLLKLAVLVVLLATITFAQNIQDPSAETLDLIKSNPEVLTILNNYFGCAQWEGTSCLKCSMHYYFNKNGICCEVKPQCMLFNQDVGICEKCYKGYGLNNGTCAIIPQGELTNPGCLTYDANNLCTKCSVRFYPGAQGVCTPVSDQCRTWNEQTGVCLSCYGGYTLNPSGQCLLSTPFVPTQNPFCAKWNGTANCLACATRAYFNKAGICQPVDDFCNTWDALTGACLTCFKGFTILDGACNLAPGIKPADIGCKLWDWENSKCLACSKNYVFNANNICVAVSDICKESDSTGLCTSCYSGYTLTAGSCLVSSSNTNSPSDLGCKTWDWNNNVCLECSQNHFLDAKKLCTPVSNLCLTFSATNGACLTCYKGYSVNQGLCLINAAVTAPDSGCATWDWVNLVCLSCSKNWVLIQGTCVPVSDQCLTFNSTTGACLTCYLGYNLLNGTCLIQDLSLVQPLDKGCADFSWAAKICLACSNKWFFNAAGVCAPVSDLCLTSDPNGNCQSCYKGYALANNTCVLSSFNNAIPTDAGCSTWNWDNQVCIACSTEWVFNSVNVCVPVSDQCASHNTIGNCLSCFSGYTLTNGACVLSAFNTANPADLGCAVWNWKDQVCLACSQKWVFNATNVCVTVSDKCATSSSSGACLTCFKGYDLSFGACIFSASNTAKPSDLGCATWDWANQICLACSTNWVFNPVKVCVPVSDKCSAHDASSVCTSCFKGYDLTNGACVLSAFNSINPTDHGCKTWDWDKQVCLACSTNWVFNANKVCVAVSNQCSNNDAAGVCTACFKGYDLTNGACIFSASNTAKPSDVGCATWDWDNQVCLACSKGWYSNTNNACVPVSDKCATSNTTGLCLTCFKGYDLSNGICVYSASNTAKPSDLGCATWNWDSQICLACSSKWVFNSNNVCVPVSDKCATSSTDGICLTCFKGYDLSNGTCVFSASNTASPSDVGCAKWDWDNKVCLECSKGFTFKFLGLAGRTTQKICVIVNPQCATYNSSGACTACFKGYNLQSGRCELSASNTAKPSDLGCSKWNWDSQVCIECSSKWVFNSANVCVPVSDKCATNDAAGLCLTCFKGYSLTNGTCIYSASNTAKPTDAGCATWDWDNQVCLTCSKNWVFNSSQICVPVSDLCASSNAAGLCLTCFKGYSLQNGICSFSAFNTARPADLGCGTWDWDNQVCLACSNKWVFNSNKKCIPVDDNCASNDARGACTGCFSGYVLNGGSCRQGNPLCKSASAAGSCTSCYTAYVLLNNNCVPISKLANIYLYYAQCCPEKLAELQANGSI